MRWKGKNRMAEPGSKRGLVRDARRAREVILDAAEAVFAEHGFDGARIDAIAKASGYNPSLLFQYFGDKLGLYTAVLKRADQEASVLSTLLFAPLLEDETIASDAHKFRTFLKTAMGAYFDYMVEHPHVMHMIIWEHAEGWQTYTKIASQLEAEDRSEERRVGKECRSR